MHDSSPLGATPTSDGVRFALRSDVADGVELCLFDGPEEFRIGMERTGSGVFSTTVPGISAGAVYGFRVHGPWDPKRGHRCNAAKLLIDPYGRQFVGSMESDPSIYGHDLGDPFRISPHNSAPHMMKSIVIDSSFDWGDDRPPGHSMADTVLYETHVKGITKNHPDIPTELRGTYAGLAHPVTIEHLGRLGVTAVELLPIHQFVQDQHLIAAGRRNYWGYNSIGFFAPHNGYAATDDPVREFKGMVKHLHAAGIEVILDVVYNHTAEGNHLGPTLSFRAIDNNAYYRLGDDLSQYLNWTGTGNTLDMSNPQSLQIVMDSLRYWVSEMRIDGFRFDLATVLGRTHSEFDPWGAFFGAISQDPVLSGAKLIAEPWDVGPHGYRVGEYPYGWSEWNDSFRDVTRDFWRSAKGVLPAFAGRLTGSADIFGPSGRNQTASVNLITAHDGFTLADVVSYNHKHNEPNGEGNRDGHSDNRSWNSGVEGPTDDPDVLKIRRRRQRSMLATLMLAQGVPMMLGGDEIGRTQRGNNNAYNQDNFISWYDWENADRELLAFTSRLIELRRSHPTFRRTRWLPEHGEAGQVEWFTPSGEKKSIDDWHKAYARSVTVSFDGASVVHDGEVVRDNDFLVMANASDTDIEFRIPPVIGEIGWELVLHTDPDDGIELANGAITLPRFVLAVLRRS
ncbi:MAG: glycogen debranching protein GlgX [Acidimicrobiia bacterium]|nr:glycogen debranching protein GlgX [Acidimicrobiia bacterium]